MSNGQEFSRLQTAGLFVFIILCGFPALEMNGFGFGLRITRPTALIGAFFGGAVGGAMLGPRPVAAGFFGGLIAGPVGLLTLYLYTQHRNQVWNVELVLVQGLGCLPGIGVGLLLKKILGSGDAAAQPFAEVDEA
jgi:hypothetical protein